MYERFSMHLLQAEAQISDGTCISNAVAAALLTTLPLKVPFPAVRLHQEPAMRDCQHILSPAIIEPRGMEYVPNTSRTSTSTDPKHRRATPPIRQASHPDCLPSRILVLRCVQTPTSERELNLLAVSPALARWCLREGRFDIPRRNSGLQASTLCRGVELRFLP